MTWDFWDALSLAALVAAGTTVGLLLGVMIGRAWE